MQDIWDRWNALSQRAQWLAMAIGAVLLALLIGMAVWLQRTRYEVLFSDVGPTDAATLTAELDKQKTPYLLADDGQTILVPGDLVHKTRIKLMGTTLPLQGAVGYEVFNNSDMGASDFQQRVNLQRAVQGELTRTIGAIEGVQSVRVHLALPERGLFRRETSVTKASVTVAMQPTKSLSKSQVIGIQRLVAASVPDLSAANVTVINQHGHALSNGTAEEADSEGTGEAGDAAQLDAKRSVEDYLVRKLTLVLDRAFGSGAAIASVDVVLNLDHARVTTEDVVAAKGGSVDEPAAGVLVKERQTTREDPAALSPTERASDAALATVVTSETDYAVGKRIEQLVVRPGAIKRQTIAIVLKHTLDDEQIARVKDLVAQAAGVQAQRGDAVVVYPMSSLWRQSETLPAPLKEKVSPTVDAGTVMRPGGSRTADDSLLLVACGVGLSLVMGLGLLVGMLTRRGRQEGPRRLKLEERERLLQRLNQIIEVPARPTDRPSRGEA